MRVYGDVNSGNCYKVKLLASQIMEPQLIQTPWLVGNHYTVADISLYGYTHVAHEGGFDLAPYPAIGAWLERVARQPGHVTMAG